MHSTASDIEWGTSAVRPSVPLTLAARTVLRSLHTRKQTGRGAASTIASDQAPSLNAHTHRAI